MIRLVLLLSMALPASAFAQDQLPPSLDYACDARTSRLDLRVEGAEAAMPRAGTVRERIAMRGLVQYGEPDARGNVRRTGSTSTTRQCGRITVRIKGGFFNLNPQGEMGAADDYPIVELLEDDKRIVGPIALGICSADSARYGYMADCPAEWATQVTAFGGGSGTRVHLRHVYNEFLKP